jgi:hypothetical protein
LARIKVFSHFLKICLCERGGAHLQNIKVIDLLGDRTQIDEYMFRLEQSQEQHYQESLKEEPSEANIL